MFKIAYPLKDFLKMPDGWYLPALVVLGYPAKNALSLSKAGGFPISGKG